MATSSWKDANKLMLPEMIEVFRNLIMVYEQGLGGSRGHAPSKDEHHDESKKKTY